MTKKKSLVQVVVDEVHNPGSSLLMKLGSAIVHADEALGPVDSPLDISLFRSLLKDKEVSRWLADMTALGLLPTKR